MALARDDEGSGRSAGESNIDAVYCWVDGTDPEYRANCS
jgi:hypothetical protein